jgi:hypothetical protein
LKHCQVKEVVITLEYWMSRNFKWGAYQSYIDCLIVFCLFRWFYGTPTQYRSYGAEQGKLSLITSVATLLKAASMVKTTLIFRAKRR